MEGYPGLQALGGSEVAQYEYVLPNSAACQITDKQIQEIETISVNKIERLWLCIYFR